MSSARRAAVAIVVVATTALLAACAPDPPGGVVGLVIDSCDPGNDTGSGIVVAPGLALTSAHVLAGAQGITVLHGSRSLAGEIVAFDPEMDLAYVAFEGRAARSLTIDSDHVDAGDTGTAWVVRDREVVPVPVTVRRRVTIRTEDIYIQGETLRPGFELDADIRAGDSGAAVVVDGRVAGVIWARSNRFENRAYAMDAVRAAGLVDEQLRTGELGPDVDIARCH
ncbi:MAG: trypsin-like peptidase domain-containing protein [Ilumatobacter sp.]|nr:trypsin-like peptidase domain-containing protein [Ilumatobacter sp.]